MKRFLALALLLFALVRPAFADHIGLYTDATGVACTFAPGFNNTATVIHKFSLGTTGSHFAISFPAGTTYFGFAPSPSVPGSFTSDVTLEYCAYTLQYSACFTGAVVLGTVAVILVPGVIHVVPAAGYPSITVTDCNNVEHVATGSDAGVDVIVACYPIVATEANTWGAVKALYR